MVLSNLPRITPCVALYGQCGGIGFTGSTCCIDSVCTFSNAYYSQCLVPSTSTTRGSTSTTAVAQRCNALYSQCGGQSWTGSTCCINSLCTFVNAYYSQCLVSPTSTTKGSTTQQSTSTTKSPTTTAAQGCNGAYGQCGGSGWTGSTTCCSGSTCQLVNSYYYQCLPISTSSTSTKSTSTAASSSSLPSLATVANDGRVNGVTTRYWDCCKASCGWTGKASVTNPVLTCKADGVTPVDVNAQSGCNGGSAYMCNNQQPWNVSSTLSYGYVAAYIAGQSESTWCCACYLLIFTTDSVAGKELIVQVTNTGGDLGNNHFDLQMPGGGFGIFNGCGIQFPSSYSGGQTYGGVSQRSDCYKLPSVLLSGCLWRFDWLQNADNPQMRFKQVPCPAALTKNTNCVRN